MRVRGAPAGDILFRRQDVGVAGAMNGNDKDLSLTRERILDAAYELFSRQGVQAVGVDAVVAKSGTGKMTLYRHFKSKEILVLGFLKRRQTVWTKQWLLARLHAGSWSPEERLLAFFDVYQEWFDRNDFEGCSFVNALVECRANEIIRNAAVDYLSEIRSAAETLARNAGLIDVERFARQWNMLLMGAIIARLSGQLEAGIEAKPLGRLLLASWPRQR